MSRTRRRRLSCFFNKSVSVLLIGLVIGFLVLLKLGCCSLFTIPAMTMMTKLKEILRTNSELECDWFVVR